MKKYLLILSTLAVFCFSFPVSAQNNDRESADYSNSNTADNIVIIHAEEGLIVYAHKQPKRLRIESSEYIKYVELLDERKILKYWQLVEPSKNLILPGKYWKTNGYWLRILSANGEFVVNLDTGMDRQ